MSAEALRQPPQNTHAPEQAKIHQLSEARRSSDRIDYREMSVESVTHDFLAQFGTETLARLRGTDLAHVVHEQLDKYNGADPTSMENRLATIVRSARFHDVLDRKAENDAVFRALLEHRRETSDPRQVNTLAMVRKANMDLLNLRAANEERDVTSDDESWLDLIKKLRI